VPDTKSCPECGGKNPRSAERCWLCAYEFAAPPRDTGLPSATPPPTRFAHAADPAAFSFSLSTLLLVMTLIAMVCGMLAVAPGLGVVLAIFSLPVLARTSGVVRKRRELGLPTPPAKRVFLFISSLFASLVTVAVVGIASIGTFCGLCIGIGSIADFSEGAVWIGFLVAIPAAIGATAGVVVLARRWTRTRWRRDMREP